MFQAKRCVQLSLLLTTSLVASRIHAQAKPQDLTAGGITLRSSFDDSVEKLRKQGFTIKPLSEPANEDTAKLPARQLIHAENGGTVEYFLEAFAGRVVAINYQVTFQRANDPNVNSTVTALNSKFGKQSGLQMPEGDRTGMSKVIDLTWYLDRNGRSRPQAGQGAFPGSCGSLLAARSSGVVVRPVGVRPAISQYETCSVGIGVELDTDRTDHDLLVYLRESILDNDAVNSFDALYYQTAKARVDGRAKQATKNPAPL